MDEFEKNNELETETEAPEVVEETAASDDETQSVDAVDEKAEEISSDMTAEADEAQEADEAGEAGSAEDAQDAEEGTTEDIGYFPEESDAVFSGGDLQSCEDISEEDTDEEESEETPEEIPEEELCKRCYSRRKDDSVEGFEYCSVCVEEMAKTKVSFGAFFYLFVSLLCFVIATAFVVVGFYIAKPVMNTGALIKQHRLSQAMGQFNEAEKRASDLNDKLPGGNENIVLFETGTKTIQKYVKLLNTVGGPINASQVMENTEGINVEKLPASLKKIYDEYQVIKETDELVYNMFQEYQASVGDGNPDYKTILEKLDKLSEENKNIYKPFMEYYRYYAAKISGESVETQLSHLEKIAEDYPDKTWLYLSPILDIYYRSGDYEKAIECCDKVLEINLNDNSAMIYKARAYFAMDKKDKANEMVELLEKNSTEEATVAAFKAEMLRREGKFDEAIAVCDDAIAKDGTAGEAYRQKAVALMLKGDMKQAHEVLSTAYEQAEISVELVEMLAISSSKTGDTEMLNEMKELLAYNNLELSEMTQACIAGTITVEQIFMEGQGDLS